MRVLVVDDEPDTLRHIGSLLRKAGHVVVESLSALDAGAQLAAQQFDLALIDYELHTQMTGLDVGKIARMRYPGIALIMVTGYDPEYIRPKIENPLQPFLAIIGKSASWDHLRTELMAHVAVVARGLEDTKP